MSKLSRDKGKVGEREVAAIVRDLTGWDVQRRVRQHEGDSDLIGAPGWSFEVKRYASAGRADIARWWAQAVAQAGDARPALFYRLDRADWRAVWPLRVHIGGAGAAYEFAIEGSVAAWAAAACNELLPALPVNPVNHQSKGTA